MTKLLSNNDTDNMFFANCFCAVCDGSIYKEIWDVIFVSRAKELLGTKPVDMIFENRQGLCVTSKLKFDYKERIVMTHKGFSLAVAYYNMMILQSEQ